MFRNILSVILIFGFFAFSSGCGQKLPPGMPKLYKTTLKVVQDGKPLEDANIVVVNEDYASSPWSSGGKTDAAGLVVLKTEGKYFGAPVGKYKVIVSKVEEPDMSIDDEDMDPGKIREYNNKIKDIRNNTFNLVGDVFMNLDTTPLRIEITPDSGEHILDVSPAVRNKFDFGPSI